MSLDVLRRYPLLSLLDSRWLADWLSSGQTMAMSLGETLLRAGTPGEQIYLLLEGRVRVLRVTKQGSEKAVGACGPGEILGEYALLPPGLNTATCRACSSGRLLRLPLAPLREALVARPAVWRRLKRWLRLHALLSLQRDSPLLGFMSASSMESMIRSLEVIRFQAVRTIQVDGLSADRWFLIARGEVYLQPLTQAPGFGPMMLGPGDSFGAQALLDDAPLPLAVAHSDTECLALRRQHFCRSSAETEPLSVQTCHTQFARLRQPLPWVGQQEASDCGLAALAMVARFHGQDVCLAELRRCLRPTDRGLSLLELHGAAAGLGLACQPVRIGLEQLEEAHLPAIAHLRNDHFVALYTFRGAGVVVGDPTVGLTTMEWTHFRQAWTGNLLLLKRLNQMNHDGSKHRRSDENM